MTPPLLSVEDLSIVFATEDGPLQAVDRAAFTVAEGETVAIVGESGSGKTVAALSLMRLLPRHSARIASGRVLFKGQDLLAAGDDAMRRLRGAGIGMIFQEPMSSLNPVLRIGDQIAEPLRAHGGLGGAAIGARVAELLSLVQMPDAAAVAQAYPHQLSGGMRQRVMIAIAIACNPALLIADEPTTALDVTIQAQILRLLKDLQCRLGMAVLLITHDLAVVSEFADRVVVMYAGRTIEAGPAAEVIARPAHPYTRGLLSATIQLGEGGGRRLAEIPGLVPILRAPPEQCTFADRCPLAAEPCRSQRPAYAEVAAGRRAACIRPFADAA